MSRTAASLGLLLALLGQVSPGTLAATSLALLVVGVVVALAAWTLFVTPALGFARVRPARFGRDGSLRQFRPATAGRPQPRAPGCGR